MIAIYSRKSKFTGKGESIGNQIELCRNYIFNHQMAESEQELLLYEDEGFSGKNLNRPMFARMMEEAKNGRLQAIVCYRLDRISRNIGDFAVLIEQLGRWKVDFVSIREQFDTSSALGRAMMYIASVFSQLERETIAERIRDNMLELAKTGRWLGGVTPTGYEAYQAEETDGEGRVRKSCHLRIKPEEAKLVRKIYRLYIKHGTLAGTERELASLGLCSKNGKPFTKVTVKNILSNPVYLIADEAAYNYFIHNGVTIYGDYYDFDGVHGIMAYNRTLQKTGRGNTLRRPQEWILAVGRHEGLIHGQEWFQVQECLKTAGRKNSK
ncbi:recombinase family protein [Anaerolentibacter hominis]|uniref:recombinase family protein n=1 Tax=Anaerolentibacter hominis TaxID=3079009 RepID=UPI0031B7F26C